MQSELLLKFLQIPLFIYIPCIKFLTYSYALSIILTAVVFFEIANHKIIRGDCIGTLEVCSCIL